MEEWGLGFEETVPESIRNALDLITRIPSYGERGAVRLLYNLLKLQKEERQQIVNALERASREIQPCPECGLLTDSDLCKVCSDPGRKKNYVCVVEESQDAYAIEKLERYKGVYHILGGRIAPLEGISPQDLNIDSLLDRIERNKVREVILATNPNAEGEATANYLLRIINSRFPKVKCTRVSYGLQFGSLIEFVDEISLEKSLENRK